MRRRDARAETGLIVVEGETLIGAALDAGLAIDTLYVAPRADESCHDLLERAAASGVRLVELPEGVLEKAADTRSPQPVMALVAHRFGSPDALETILRGTDLVVVAVDVRDPGNAGTLVRSGEACGAGAVIFCEGSVDVSSPKVIRASAGAVFGVPMVVGSDPEEVLVVSARLGFQRLGATPHGGLPYDTVDLRLPTALVVGNEAWGLAADRDLERLIDQQITIPMAGSTESLNVGVAAAVVLFEAARQRRVPKP